MRSDPGEGEFRPISLVEDVLTPTLSARALLVAAPAAFIGWADGPFQFEVATASLGFSIVGFLAAFSGFDRRLAAIVGPAMFALGAAAGHVYQMVTEHNFAPGNAGIIFYMDFVIPFFGFLLLWLGHRGRRVAV